MSGDATSPVDVLHPTREQYLVSALQMLSALIPADATTWNAVDVTTGATEVFHSDAGAQWGEAAAVLLQEVAADHPMVLSYLKPATRAGGLPRRMSDIVSNPDLHRTRAYAELLHPFAAEHQLTILTGRGAGQSGRCWTLNRSGPDFTEDEREVAARLQPILIALDVVCSMSPPAVDEERIDRLGLTPREIEVLRLVDLGLTAAAIGRVLRISGRTVSKHLENAYNKLGTHDRLMAAKLVRDLGIVDRADTPDVTGRGRPPSSPGRDPSSRPTGR